VTLTLAEANSIVDVAIAKARQLDVKVSVAVCDDQGHLIALNRMDGAYAEVNRFSIGKAVASAATGPRAARLQALSILRRSPSWSERACR
jgi:uncharacterized protein GlcG (DUF336 family)